MGEYTIMDIPKRLLDMAKSVKAIFEAHDIQYMIAYGTLLGAVRHQGFIPWDDDFDFYVFDDCYDRAIALLRENLSSDLFVEDEVSEPLFFHAWARVKDLRTVTSYAYYPQDAVYAHKGLSLDLYRAKFTRYKDINKFKADEYQKYIDRRRDKKLTQTSHRKNMYISHSHTPFSNKHHQATDFCSALRIYSGSLLTKSCAIACICSSVA